MYMHKVIQTQTMLKYAYGIVVLVVGLDKLFATNFIVNWGMYVNSYVLAVIPINVFLIIIALVEIAVAILLLTKYTRLAAYVSAAWLLLIAANLVMLGYVDIAARDVLLAVGALALARLTEAVESGQQRMQTAVA